MKKKRCKLTFSKAQKEIEELSKLNADQYIDMYYGDASHFGLVPNVPYAWQSKDDPVLLPSIRGKSTSVFGLMNTLGDLVYDFFDKTINSEMLIVFFDRFAQTIVKKTVVVLDNSSLHTSKKFKEKIKEWKELDLLIYFIPPYSPELNKIEILWRFVKYKWLKFDAYISFENLKASLKNVLDNFGKKCIINF
ncbi:IS630 family transposase [Chryseobacterium mucoviscidosis]|uniref:IS630 family transposase n=1 Tax=Chryseobacterium mucoviscidosis TaxID=1945581 RepID=UPI00301AFE51